MMVLLNAATAFLAIGGLAVAILAGIGWRRSGQPRLGALAFAFLVFGAAGIWTAIGLFTGAKAIDLLTAQTVLVAGGLLVAYLAAVKR